MISVKERLFSIPTNTKLTIKSQQEVKNDPESSDDSSKLSTQ